MRPGDLAKSGTEHAHQRAFFQWINFASRYGFKNAKLLCLGHITAQQVQPSEELSLPELALMHAIPNGGYRRGSEASKLKAEGVRAGVSDTFLPVPMPFSFFDLDLGQESFGSHAGLYIEFKEPKRRNHARGGVSQAQAEFLEAVRAQGYQASVAYTWQEAANIVMTYYGAGISFDVT